MEQYPRPTSEFDMTEIYRIIHNERIPGFVLLESERAYLEEYRAAIMAEQNIQDEPKNNVPEEEPAREPIQPIEKPEPVYTYPEKVAEEVETKETKEAKETKKTKKSKKKTSRKKKSTE